MSDQAQPLRDFVAQQNADTDQKRSAHLAACDEFDRMTDPHSSEPYRDKYGNIVVDVEPKRREEFEDYKAKMGRL